MDYATTLKRMNDHISVLQKWKVQGSVSVGEEERGRILGILDEALELSQRNTAFGVVKSVQDLLEHIRFDPDSQGGNMLLIQVKVYMLPIIFRRIGQDDPIAADLAFFLGERLQQASYDSSSSSSSKTSLANVKVDTASIALMEILPVLVYTKLPELLKWSI
ncbi:hypothetical protein M422DRAFT_270704 [Sphaerobolus stellatus SS14]|uniref:Uncharacterized protein n=1 Tax=Sphaerobolus stellatus (strain SS14) TaxID=990650 RepID=A0A0C9TFF2_SPHS4|nr:hypothetical protein M422DRAFT_270704 [Sphaerobolus stellatus SS14]